MNENDAPSEEDVRSIARLELSTTSEARNRLMDEHAASFRWLIASLFAANGGALITLGASEEIPPYARIWACGWFTLGTLFSLLTAWFNQKLIQRALDPLAALIAFWGCIAHGLDFDEEKHTNLIGDLQRSLKRSWPVQASGWLAVAMFLFGMIAVGSGYWNAVVQNERPAVEQKK